MMSSKFARIIVVVGRCCSHSIRKWRLGQLNAQDLLSRPILSTMADDGRL